jgi:hypothetical protein
MRSFSTWRAATERALAKLIGEEQLPPVNIGTLRSFFAARYAPGRAAEKIRRSAPELAGMEHGWPPLDASDPNWPPPEPDDSGRAGIARNPH